MKRGVAQLTAQSHNAHYNEMSGSSTQLSPRTLTIMKHGVAQLTAQSYDAHDNET
jgi:hypothetical protein